MNSPSKMKKILPQIQTKAQFQGLLQDIREEFGSQEFSSTNRVTVLFNMQKMNLQDEIILEKTADLISRGIFKNQNQLTNALYCLAKLRYKHKYGTEYIDAAME